MSNGDTAFQKVVSCIPQVYFDIIGRVIPGTLIMGSIWISVCGPKEFWTSLDNWIDESTASSVTVSIVLVILTSYTLAILIWCVWSCLITTIYSNSETSEIEDEDQKIYWDNKKFRFKYERLKDKKISAGNRVTKLKAQIHMAETLFIGLPLSCLIGVITYWIGIVTYFLSCSEPKTVMPSLFPRFVSWVFLLLVAVCSLFARQYCIAHMNDSLKNNLKLLGLKKKDSNRNEDERRKKGEMSNSVGDVKPNASKDNNE